MTVLYLCLFCLACVSVFVQLLSLCFPYSDFEFGVGFRSNHICVWVYLSWWPAVTPLPPATGCGPGQLLPAWCFQKPWRPLWWSQSQSRPESAGSGQSWVRPGPPPAPRSASSAPLTRNEIKVTEFFPHQDLITSLGSDMKHWSGIKLVHHPGSEFHYGTRTFLGQVELFELGPFLVELGLQLLFEADELGPLLLQCSDTLLQNLWMTAKTQLHSSSVCVHAHLSVYALLI